MDDDLGTEARGRAAGHPTANGAAGDAHPTVGSLPAGGGINRVVAGRYELLEAIGEGPLFVACRARDRALNRIVAVKRLRADWAKNPALAERLRAGLSGVLSLNHPVLTRVYDVGSDEEGVLFLAEEYVRGIDLKERIRRVAPFSLPAATDVALALAEALEYAHARGIVHGDLRPANVLIGPEGNVKLTGLGISGTLPLLSDDDTVQAPTFSSDLYALGAALYEMLTGDLPYGTDDPVQIAQRHATSEVVPSPRALNPGVPNALDGIVRRTLARRREERYGSASEMLTDLRAVRDALRSGGSLSWSPLDRAAAPLYGGTAAAAVAGVDVPPLPSGNQDGVADTTIVMPAQAPRKRSSGRADRARERDLEPAPPPPPVRGNRWLLSLNLFLFSLVLAGAAALAYMTLNFFQTPSDVIVPNLVGRSMTLAEARAAQGKFTLSVVDERYMDDKKYPASTIYRMEPEPGRHIREGKPVKVWVSKGPRLVVVPDVRDMSVEGAKRTLENTGLRLGQRTYQFDPLVAKGNVLSQTPDTGEEVPRGQTIKLVLSKGEEPPPPPIYMPIETPETSTPETPADEGDVGAGDRVRLFTVRYPDRGALSAEGAPHRIRIDVTDKSGTRTVYDEEHAAGERVEEEVEGVGKRVTIKLFDNDELKSEQTR
jgi:serine/threonine protein kinase